MITLLFFSGTGNTFWTAKQIAQTFGEKAEVLNIAAEMLKPPGVITAEKTVILFPAYAWQMPHLVRRFILRTEFRSPYIAVLVTYGTGPGGAPAEAHRVFRKKKQTLSYAGRIPAVENYIPLFGPPGKRTVEKRLALQAEATAEAAEAIAEGRTNRVWSFRPLSAFISSLFRLGKRLFVRGYRPLDICNGCGICARICPARAISMENGRPVFSSACEHCQGCLNWCPRRAIRYIRMKPGSPRWRHPGVAAPELFRENPPGIIRGGD
ncbi:MAG: EFR1 family ferrodoxin [Spirochaetaceae bacterium]|nr:EFR1 family ferrodoxin [Spirochaetaceae bacterium]